MRKLLAPGFLALLPLATQSQQVDMAAMQKWGAADVVRYHIVGTYQANTYIASDGSGAAHIKDRVVIDLTWKLSEAKLVGTPTFQNTKSTTLNPRDREPSCLPPVLKGEYEHYELLSVKDGLGGALEFQVRSSYPAVEVAQSCTASRRTVPAKIEESAESFALPSPVLFAMPLPQSEDLAVSADRKSFIVKKSGWTWQLTPSIPGG